MRFLIKSSNQKKQTAFLTQKVIELLLCLLFFAQISFAQVLKDVDEIFPFQGELVAIKKGSLWAFINSDGVKVIDFRNDLVATKDETTLKSYPLFMEDKCLIRKKINGIYYYGYIDKSGKTIIEPKFLNATNFKNGYALIIQLENSKMGSNSILGTSITNTKLEEYVIDSSGNTVKYLENARGYTSSKKPPAINAKFISTNLVAVKGLNGKWTVHKFQ